MIESCSLQNIKKKKKTQRHTHATRKQGEWMVTLLRSMFVHNSKAATRMPCGCFLDASLFLLLLNGALWLTYFTDYWSRYMLDTFHLIAYLFIAYRSVPTEAFVCGLLKLLK